MPPGDFGWEGRRTSVQRISSIKMCAQSPPVSPYPAWVPLTAPAWAADLAQPSLALGLGGAGGEKAQGPADHSPASPVLPFNVLNLGAH